jgi:hypothetical protein
MTPPQLIARTANLNRPPPRPLVLAVAKLAHSARRGSE